MSGKVGPQYRFENPSVVWHFEVQQLVCDDLGSESRGLAAEVCVQRYAPRG